MKSVLLGNGINIQFGGKAYSNYFIMERIRYRAKLDSYLQLFGNVLTSCEIVSILDGFVNIANDLRNGAYDQYMDGDKGIEEAIKDFKCRYNANINASYEIMLEDWFLLVQVFFLKNNDLTDNKTAAIQGFERLILDAIYNGGKIQELFKKMPRKVKRFFNTYDNIFTLNYDNNLEMLTKKTVFHLHGDFSVLANSENIDNVQGYIRSQRKNLAIIKGMEHCFCNALLNYSGLLKYKTAKDFHNLIIASNKFKSQYENDPVFREQLSDLSRSNPYEYEMIMTKIEHPELNMASEYHFDRFETISDELHIIGMSPNNDAHIFNLINNNKALKKVVFYYFSETEKNYIEENFPKELFSCEYVGDLWKILDCVKPKYTFNYRIPSDIDNFISCFNVLSESVATKENVLNEIAQIPQFEMERLCKLVKEDMQIRNPEHKPTNEDEFRKSTASISYIALQEGILPSTLYLICVMNFHFIKDN
ncbi:MAG: hypothetical protein IKK91_03165 [Ruminococcus sp.]|nr:hypothetical protein [Ruminococcus sp.]